VVSKHPHIEADILKLEPLKSISENGHQTSNLSRSLFKQNPLIKVLEQTMMGKLKIDGKQRMLDRNLYNVLEQAMDEKVK